MGNCFGGGHQSDELQQQQQNGPQKQRREITETERIEIDLKKTRDTLQRNKQKVNAQINTVETVIKKLISEQKRDKAKKEFQKKQLYEKYLDNIEDKSIVIQKMIHEVKSAQMDKECMEVMKNANNFLKDIQKAIDIDDAQDIMQNMQENDQQSEQFNQLYQQYGVNEDDPEAIKEFQAFEAKLLGDELNKNQDKPNIDQNLKKDTKFVIFTGNPGSVYFYDNFLQNLYEKFDKQHDIYCIGLAGQFDFPKKPFFQSLYNLDQEIEIKYLFMKKLSEQFPDSQFIIIGHSIGTFLTVQNIRKWKQSNIKIVHYYLLFPVFERILHTPNGKATKHFVKDGIRQLLSSIFIFFKLLPKSFRRYLAYTKTFVKGKPQEDIAEAALKYYNYSNFQNMLYVSKFEYKQVNEFDYTLIEEFKENITLYYSNRDLWCPIDFYKEMKQKFPENKNIYLDKYDLEHAFVMGGSDIMANFLQQNILQKKLI